MIKMMNRISSTAMLAVAFMLCATSAWATVPVPTVVWDGDFEDNVGKTGSDGNTYTFKLDDTGNSVDNGVLVISSSASKGATIVLGDQNKTKISILIKYSNLSAPGGTSTTNCLASISLNSDANFPLLRNENSSSLAAGLGYAGTAAAARQFRGVTQNFATTAGCALFSYNSDSGTRAYVGANIASLAGGENTTIKWGSAKPTKISLGGPYKQNTNSGTTVWPNVRIEKVAIFVNEYYSNTDVSEYKWPSEVKAELSTWFDDDRTVYAWRDVVGGDFAYAAFSKVDANGVMAATNSVSNYFEFMHTKDNYKKPGYVLYYDASGYTQNSSAGFSDLSLGGLCVKAEASAGKPYTIRGYNSVAGWRSTALGHADYETYFEFDESFVIARTNGTVSVRGVVNIDVKTGKYFDCNSVQASGSDFTLDQNATVRLSGGGEMRVPTFDASASGTTLDLSNATSEPFIVGKVKLGSETEIILPAGTTSPYKIGTAVEGTYPSYVTIGTKRYAATLSSGANAGEMEWDIVNATISVARDDYELESESVFPTVSSTKDYGLTVTADATLDVGTSAVRAITIDVAEGKTLTLSGTSLTATTIYITGKGVVKVAAGGTLKGTVKGDGTVMYSGVLPTVGNSGAVFTDSAWEGAVWIYDYGSDNGTKVTSNLTADMPSWGNANSQVKFTKIRAYAPNNDITCVWTLVLEDEGDTSSGYAWRCDDGYGANTLKIAELKGDGTFFDGGSLNATFTFSKATDFRGTFNIWNTSYAGHKILIGDNASHSSAGSVAIGAGQTVTINKAWTVRNDLKVDGTVNVNAAITTGSTGILVYGTANYDASIAKPTIVYDGGTLNVNAADSGSITVNSGGTANIAADITGAISVAGTVNIKESASAKFSSIGGTLNVDANKTLSVNGNTDSLNYGGSGTVNVYGTLNMGTTRWTIGSSNVINLYEGGTISGAGESTNGALDWHTTGTLNVYGTSTISANIRCRDNGNLSFNVVSGTCTFSGELYGGQPIRKTGEGKLKIAYTGSNASYPNNLPSVEAGSIELATGTYSFGSNRDLSGYTMMDGGDAVIKIVQTQPEYGNGETVISNIDDSVESITIVRFDGTSTTVTPSSGTATLSEAVVVSGAACWHAYEMDKSTGTGTYGTRIADSGTGNVPLQLYYADFSDSNFTQEGESDNWYLKYNEKQPYPTSGYNLGTEWTAAIRCTVPTANKGIVVAFGTQSAGLIGLAAGENAGEVIIVRTTGNSQYTKLATMTVAHPTEAQHVYVFTKTADAVTVYCDGDFINRTTVSFTSPSNFQIGSVYGGLGSTGLVAANSGEMDYLRIYNFAITPSMIAKLASDNPYVSPSGTYTRTVTGNADWVDDDAWTVNYTATTADAPGNDAVAALTANSASTMTINLSEASLYEELTFDGSAAVRLEAGSGTAKFSAVKVNVDTDVTVAYGAADFSATRVSVADGKTLNFDFSAEPINSQTERQVVYLTGVTAEPGDLSDSSTWPVQVTTHADASSLSAGFLSRFEYEASSSRYVYTYGPDHTIGGEVYYTGGYWSSNSENTISVTNSYGEATIVFSGDTVVIPAYYPDATTWSDSTLPANVTKIRVSKSKIKVCSGADSGDIFTGVTWTVDSDCVLWFGVDSKTTSLGAMTINGPGSVECGNITINGAMAGNAPVKILDNVTTRLTATGSIATAHTISGSASAKITVAKTTPISDRMTFGTWTGTVSLPENFDASAGVDLHYYGQAGSIVEINGFSGWLKVVETYSGAGTYGRQPNPHLKLNGAMSITGLSAAYYDLKGGISGTGNFELASTISNKPSGNSFWITKVSDYTGSIVNNTTGSAETTIVITELVADSFVGGAKLLSRGGSGPLSISKVTVGETEQSLSDLCYESDGVYVTAAEYNSVKYYSVAAAIAQATDANLADITLLNGCTTAPEEYYISEGHVVKCQAAIIDTEGTAHYFATPTAAAAAVDSYLGVGEQKTYDYFAVYFGTDVEMQVNLGANAWSVFPVKVKCLNGATVSVVPNSVEYEFSAGDPDENSIVTYTKTEKATTYVWAGTGEITQNWGNYNRWKVETSEGATATRAPSTLDTVVFNGGAPISISGVTVAAVQVGGVATISGSGTLTATSGIVLTDSAATLTVTGVTLSPAPTTNVSRHRVVSSADAGTTTYRVEEIPGTIFSVY